MNYPLSHEQNCYLSYANTLNGLIGFVGGTVMDTKWKLLDQNACNGTDKYSLCQAEFYQLYAYGQKYMNGKGDMIFYFSKI